MCGGGDGIHGGAGIASIEIEIRALKYNEEGVSVCLENNQFLVSPTAPNGIRKYRYEKCLLCKRRILLIRISIRYGKEKENCFKIWHS